MKKLLLALLLATPLVAVPGMASAKGCLKGAAVGGVAGHVLGKHAVVGAVAGCAIENHREKGQDKKTAAEAARQSQSNSPSERGTVERKTAEGK
jgi:outer membrane lipoprotein SlyB